MPTEKLPFYLVFISFLILKFTVQGGKNKAVILLLIRLASISWTVLSILNRSPYLILI